MQLVAAQLEKRVPEGERADGANVVSLRDQVSRQARLLLLALFGAALCVLLIACTNLASLFLARAMQRRKELSVRAALGAGRERLVRQLLTESLVLAAAGGALGVLLAVAALPLLARLVPNSLPIAETPALDLRVLAFAAAHDRRDGDRLRPRPRPARLPRGVMRPVSVRGPGAGIGRKERLRSVLVVAEVTVSVVLLVSSGLLIRALWRVQTVDPGFRSRGRARPCARRCRCRSTSRRHGARSSTRASSTTCAPCPAVTDAAYISYLPMVMRGGIWGDRGRGQPRGHGRREHGQHPLRHAWLLRDARHTRSPRP